MAAFPFRMLSTAVLCVVWAQAQSQIPYASGQNVVPVYEGWERNPDGSYNMVFGYMNRNYEEEVDVPVGTDNSIEPGSPDQGQPTHFYQRRQEFVFKVKVPKDWGDKDLIWTLGSHGKVEKAYGSLLPIWELGPLVYLENRRGAAFLTYPEEPNKPPTIEVVGSSKLTAAIGETVTLSADVSDDGYPKPRARPVRSGSSARERGRDPGSVGFRNQSPVTQAIVKLDPNARLGVTWVVYRGKSGAVKLEPMRVVAGTGPPGAAIQAGPLNGKAITKVTFSEPGTYVLRAYADDGVFTTPADVIVTVQATKR